MLNIDELTKLASKLNGGKGCTFLKEHTPGQGLTMGCANYHGYLVFDDQTKWLVRMPIVANFVEVPAELVEYLVESEYATFKFLESTAVPAPKAFGFGLASDPENKVGPSYILIEHMSGEPHDAYGSTPEQHQRVISQYADILIELSKHPFPKAGSLVWRDGKPEVSAVASNRFVALGKYGPFESSSEYLRSISEQYLDLIAEGLLHYKYPKEAFVYHYVLKKHVEALHVDKPSGPFYLKHVDDRGDHLLVDDNHNITGVIDWQFARTAPAEEVFGPTLFTTQNNNLWAGISEITENDKLLAQQFRAKGRPDLADLAEGDDLMRLFHFGIATEATNEEAFSVIDTLRKRIGETTGDLQQWIAAKADECRGDPRWEKVEALVEQMKSLPPWNPDPVGNSP